MKSNLASLPSSAGALRMSVSFPFIVALAAFLVFQLFLLNVESSATLAFVVLGSLFILANRIEWKIAQWSKDYGDLYVFDTLYVILASILTIALAFLCFLPLEGSFDLLRGVMWLVGFGFLSQSVISAPALEQPKDESRANHGQSIDSLFFYVSLIVAGFVHAIAATDAARMVYPDLDPYLINVGFIVFVGIGAILVVTRLIRRNRQ